MNISKEASYYTFSKCERIETIGFYNQFINWIIAEFDLYQIEEYEGLRIYFPNGWCNINVSFKSKKCIDIIIKIKSKTVKDGKKIENQISTVNSKLKKLLQN